MTSLESFLQEMEASLTMAESGSLKGDTVFRDLDWWDSLAMLGVLAVFDSYFQRQIQPSEIQGCRTIEDLYHYGVSLTNK